MGQFPHPARLRSRGRFTTKIVGSLLPMIDHTGSVKNTGAQARVNLFR
jgi:hypothetical protein